MVKKKIFHLFLFFILFGVSSLAHNQHTIDSLRTELNKIEAHKRYAGVNPPALMDSTKANIFYAFVREYWGSIPDSAIVYAEKCKSLSEKIGYRKGVGNAYNGFGLINMFKGRNYPLALQSFQMALKIRTEIGDKTGLGWTYNNMGLCYGAQGNYIESIKSHSNALKIRTEIGDREQMSESSIKRGDAYKILGNYPEALKNYLTAKKLAEECGFKEGIEGSYTSIGRLYEAEGNYSEALKNFIASSRAREKAGDKFAIATSYFTLGEIYLYQGDTNIALKKFNDALKLFEEVNNGYGISQSNSNIGDVSFYQGRWDEALNHYQVSLKTSEELKDKIQISNLFIAIAKVYEKQGNYQKALSNVGNALSLALTIRYKVGIREAYKNLSEIYAKLNNYKAAYSNSVLFKQAYDSTFNEENERRLTSLQLQSEFDKKESLAKAEQEKKDALTLKELQKQKFLRNLFVIGFALLLIFAFIIFILVIQYREIRLIKKERNRISRELHDDIGAELNRITMISQLLHTKMSKDNELQEKLLYISEAGKKVLDSISEIIWTMNPQKDNLESLFASIRRFVVEYFEMYGIEVMIEFPDEIPAKSVSDEFRRNIFLVIKEAIHNITKYANASRVQISMDLSEKSAVFGISDNGIGFFVEEKQNWGNGLRNMNQRMKDIRGDFRIRSVKNQGTFIKLIFPVH